MVFLLVAVTAITVYPVLSDIQKMVAFLIVSFATVPATVIGITRTAVGARSAFWTLLAGLICLDASNVAWYWYVFALHLPTGDGTIATLFAALGQVFMFCGAIIIVARRGRNDVGGMVDSIIMSMAVGGVIWDFVLLPHMRVVHTPQMTQVAACVAVFALTGILGCLTRLLLTAREFIPALWFLVAAMASSLSGVVAVSLKVDPGTAGRPAYTDMIYLAGFTWVGLCALSWSTPRLLQPGPAPRDDLSKGRLAFLGFALCALPVVAGAREYLGQPVDVALIAIDTAAVTPLVMGRIWWVWTERVRTLRYQASHDPVTTLPNRQEFANRLNTSLADGRPLVVLFCDLDGFKAVNDRFGHAGGDQLLIEAAERLRRCVREGDTVSRFGGDEFVFLCVDAGRDDASQLCRRIDEALHEPFHIGDQTATIGASIGIVWADGAKDGEELIKRADAAMYTAKRQRRGTPGVRTVTA